MDNTTKLKKYAAIDVYVLSAERITGVDSILNNVEEKLDSLGFLKI